MTKKLVKLTKYASAELKISNHKIVESSLASEIVIPTTSSSIIIEAGRRNATATGAMYIRRFIEFSFSLRNQRNYFITSLAKILKLKIPCHGWHFLSAVHDEKPPIFKYNGSGKFELITLQKTARPLEALF